MNHHWLPFIEQKTVCYKQPMPDLLAFGAKNFRADFAAGWLRRRVGGQTGG
jgi:hypothetical protein